MKTITLTFGQEQAVLESLRIRLNSGELNSKLDYKLIESVIGQIEK